MQRTAMLLGLLALFCPSPADAQNNWNPQDLTPGAALRVEFVQRIPGVVLARLHAEGFPKREKLALSSWTLSSEEKADSAKPVPVMLNESGEVRQENGTEFKTGFSEEAVGETFVIGLATTDGRVRALVRVTPFPIEARSGPCRLFAEAVEPLGAAFRITATGFAPDDEIKIVAASKKKLDESAGKTRADGSWQGRVPLLVGNQKVSTTTLTVAGKSCSVNITLSRRTPPMPLPVSIGRIP